MGTAVENRQDRIALAEDAGWGRISVTSVIAGILVAYGAFAVLAGLTAAVLGALNIDVDLSGSDLRRAGTAGGIVLGLVLFVSWYFGAYTTGRMARRAGATHGIVVFFVGVLVAVSAAALVEALDATDQVVDRLEQLGVPTTSDQWSDIGTVAGIASLVGMLLGCVLGGTMGERWHTKLVTRALDPGFGPEADAANAQKYAVAAQQRAARARERRGEVNLTDQDRDEAQIDVTAATPKPDTKTPQTRKPESRRKTRARQKTETAAAKARAEETSTTS